MTNDLSALSQRLGVDVDPQALTHALTHRSFAYENGGLPTNERLEFLGDSVLGLVVTDKLYRDHPELPEGQLAKMRAAIVNSVTLADVARELGLGEFLLLGKGEANTGGRDKSSILADTVEAIVGCVYLDCGLQAAADVIHRLFDSVIDHAATMGAGLDWKTSLQELTAANSLGVPEYLLESTGPDHDREFTARVQVGDEQFGSGIGRTKKQAEQFAAKLAWEELNQRTESGS